MSKIFKEQIIKLDRDIVKIICLSEIIPFSIIYLTLLVIIFYFTTINKLSKFEFVRIVLISTTVYILFIIYILLVTKIFQRTYSYTIGKEGIIIVSGVFTSKKEYIPYNIIQNLDISSGPIMRKYNYSNLEIKILNDSNRIRFIKNRNLRDLKEKIINNKNLYEMKF